MTFSVNQVPTLNALFKQTYASEVENAIPERELLMKSIPFVTAEKQNGAGYNQPVILSRHHGVTYLGSNDDNLQINPAVAAIVKNASVVGSGMLLSGLLSYQAAARASKGGPSFIDATSYLVEGLTDSFSAVHEQTFFYGGKGLLKMAAAEVSGSAPTYTYTAPTNPVEWASALWVGAEGMKCDIYNGSTYKATVDVTGVDIAARTLTLTGSGWTAADGDTLYRKQSYGLEAKGLHYIMSTDANFGIDGSQFGLWKGSRYDVGTAFLSFQKVAQGIAIAYGRGLEGSMDLHVNPLVFAGIIPDFLTSKTGGTSTFAGREFDNSADVERIKHGSKAIQFIINNVETNLISNDYVKGGLAFGVAQQTLLRVGSSDMTFDLPGATDSGQYFRSLDTHAGLELRMFSDQGLFCKAPAKNILFTGIKVA